MGLLIGHGEEIITTRGYENFDGEGCGVEWSAEGSPDRVFPHVIFDSLVE